MEPKPRQSHLDQQNQWRKPSRETNVQLLELGHHVGNADGVHVADRADAEIRESNAERRRDDPNAGGAKDALFEAARGLDDYREDGALSDLVRRDLPARAAGREEVIERR